MNFTTAYGSKLGQSASVLNEVARMVSSNDTSSNLLSTCHHSAARPNLRVRRYETGLMSCPPGRMKRGTDTLTGAIAGVRSATPPTRLPSSGGRGDGHTSQWSVSPSSHAQHTGRCESEGASEPTTTDDGMGLV